MQSTKPNPPVGGPPLPPSAPANGPKRRQRVDSNPQSVGSTAGAAPDPKRPRSEHYGEPLSTPNPASTGVLAMSSKALGKRPEFADMPKKNRIVVPQQPAGPRKLVIKNLRSATDRHAEEGYFRKVWAELDAAVAALFAGETPHMPFERMYRGTEDLCSIGKAPELAQFLGNRCKQHLRDSVDDEIKRGEFRAADDNVALLRSVITHWQRWSRLLRILRSTFAFLDRSYLLHLKTKESAQINDMGIREFKLAIFGSSRRLESGSIGDRAIAAVCELVDMDRRGGDRFDSALLKDSIAMLRVLGIYGIVLETGFLAESHSFFQEFARDRSENGGLKDYIASCVKLLERERARSDGYNFDSSTKWRLLDDAHETLIKKYASLLLDSDGVSRLLDDNDTGSMAALYQLLKLSGIQKELRAPWQDYIQRAGASIVGDLEKDDEMVTRLLLLRRSLEKMIRDAFDGDDNLTHGLRDAFGYFINRGNVNSKWNTGTSKVGEMIAKYMDMLLRGGLKVLPPSLLSDHKDRAQAEKSGEASTSDEDAELDRQLDAAVALFRFIDGKDVFAAFYKKDLSRRLLMGRSASQDAEQRTISKLKSECGSSFTTNFEQMFKDHTMAKEHMEQYRVWRQGLEGEIPKTDFHATILTKSSWPNYPDVPVRVPANIAEHIQHYEKYYLGKHTGRKLWWMHGLATANVAARFDRGPKELMVSGFQAIVLVLFNEEEGNGGSGLESGVRSYKQLLEATDLADAELQRTLQSLACGKLRVLTKHPKGRDVMATDTFTVNKAFWDPKFRVKINQIQLKETPAENKETHERVAADRQFETQAAIVRILKARKTMPHAQLVAEVIDQTKKRGALDPKDIKANLEKLIDKDYIERDDTSYSYVA